MGRAAGGYHPPQGAWALTCGCSPRLWAAAGPSPWPRALCSSLGRPGRSVPLPKTHREGRVAAAVVGAGDSQKRWRTPGRCEHGWRRGPCPARRCLATGASPFTRSASPHHPGIPGGGMGLGGCCGIRRPIPAGPSSLPLPLAPARPPAKRSAPPGPERWEPAAESPPSAGAARGPRRSPLGPAM